MDVRVEYRGMRWAPWVSTILLAASATALGFFGVGLVVWVAVGVLTVGFTLDGLRLRGEIHHLREAIRRGILDAVNQAAREQFKEPARPSGLIREALEKEGN